MAKRVDVRHRCIEDVPECPDCEGQLFVERSSANDAEWVCHRCDVRFDRPDFDCLRGQATAAASVALFWLFALGILLGVALVVILS